VIDVTDASFETDVLVRSDEVPVVIDLWAEWCGPCKTLGPIIESVVAETAGKVELVKVDVDQNPRISQSFQVQSIPAVFAIRNRQVIGSFIGAKPEGEVRQFVQGLLPSETELEVARLLALGDEASLRAALELDPAGEAAVIALAELLATTGRGPEALELLAKIPETAEARRIAAIARTGGAEVSDDVDAKLADLLERVKGDDEARQEFVDLLDLLGADDPRVPEWRKRLTQTLY
jgi:putative thioredoxin